MDQGPAASPWPEDRRGRVLRIAEAWGVTPPYVYQKERKGCPLSSLEEANLWRQANAKLGVGYRSHGSKSKQDGAGGAGRVMARKSGLSSLEDSLREAVLMEEEAAAVVKAILSDPDRSGQVLNAMNAFNKAQANRMEREKGVMELLEAQKRVVPIDFAIEILRAGWSPLLSRLRSMAKRAAPRANPSDDVLAEAAISEEVEDAISEAERTYAQMLEAYA